VMEVAGELPDPLRGKSVGDLWKAALREEWAGSEPVCLDGPEKEFEPSLGPLGSGSDFTVFQDHLGIASLSFGFNGRYGVYHAIMDDFFWMKRFGDPDFIYTPLAARFYGLLAMRLGSADIVPLRYVPYASALEKHLDDIRRQAVRERRGAAGAETPGAKPPLDPDFRPLLSSLAQFRRSAAALDAALDALTLDGAPAEDLLPRINDQVVGVEREFLLPEGITGRPWFRHVIYAPGTTTGYASWPFPGLTEALKEHDTAAWERESRRVLERLKAAGEALDRATALARPAAGPGTR
jgi:N-acetylated-alpha-linked acidic dipeptidase